MTCSNLATPLGYGLAGLGSSAELAPAPFRSESHFSSGGLGGDDPWRLVCAAHHFHCACDCSDGIHHVDEDSPYDADAPDAELEEGCVRWSYVIAGGSRSNLKHMPGMP